MPPNQSRDQTQNKASVGTLSPEQFLRRCGNPQPSIRSLVEIVGVKSVFISLHLHFAFILRNIIYPPISPSSIPPRLVNSTYASVFRSSIGSSSLDSPDQSEDESNSPYLFLFDLFGSMSRYSFMHLLNHVVMGDQIIVRGDEEPVMKIIHVLKVLLTGMIEPLFVSNCS
ncbi:hypothetical protein BKA69DRAFT_699702 [Paraphysoderma sedebokerense]|nr:hypothetical protein BKA69DRAFT_699702 [Paraphysoderma sedebokerense]